MEFKEDKMFYQRIGRIGDTSINLHIIVPGDVEAEEMFDLFGGKKFVTTGKVVRVLANRTHGKYLVATALVTVAGIGPLVRAHRAGRYQLTPFAEGEEVPVLIELASAPRRLEFPPLETLPRRHKLPTWEDVLGLWV